ncbi:MAG: hypothetical protein JW847_03435 [Candidatus Omnitrophica bacterium]|nr:hypothetical protein [Candidatus Omnitrophota bacterium]
MNIKFVILTSFTAALLLHLFVFNLFTFSFAIDPISFNPKFFFLGQILQQEDVYQRLPNVDINETSRLGLSHFGHDKTMLKNIYYEIADPGKKPFNIKSIEKPIVPQTTDQQGKVVIKSTFPLPTESAENVEIKNEGLDDKLGIQPYRPLRSRLP